MDFRGIPVRTIGPGSQPVDEDGASISYIDMPKDMSRYEAPSAPEPDLVANLPGACETMRWLQNALSSLDDSMAPKLADLSGLDNDSRELVNQILGEGEVSITDNGSSPARTQESVLAGVWRTLFVDQHERVIFDLLEVADIPHYVRAGNGRTRAVDTSSERVPDDVCNALPILIELDAYCATYAAGAPAEVINLSLLPMSDADLAFLDQRLGYGGIDILSRSYGKCQVSATAVPNVWWVRYYNSMSTLILNTLEVVDVPKVACAAPEDLRDSAIRLDEILAPYAPALA